MNTSVAGKCYVATELLYHLFGGKKAGWTPQVVHHEGGTHWYLKHNDGTIVDPTAAQFATPVPYSRGRGCGLLTSRPSKRSRAVALKRAA